MNNYTNGKIVIAGNSIAELEQELAKVKALLAMGYNCGVGGKSIAEVDNGLKMVGGTPPHCCCNCGCCEDEDEDLYDEEDEDEADVDLDEIADDLRDVGYALATVLEKLGAI